MKKNLKAYIFVLLIALYTIIDMTGFGLVLQVFSFNLSGYRYMIMLAVEVFSLFIIIPQYDKIGNSPLAGLAFFWSLWGVFICVFVSAGSLPVVFSIIEMLHWPFVLLASYMLVLKSPHTVKILTIGYGVVFIIAGILYFMMQRGLNSAEYLYENNLENIFFSANTIFYPLMLLPWILFIQNKKIISVVLIAMMILAILSSKRSALIIAGIVFVSYIYRVLFRNKTQSGLTKLAVVVLLISATVFISRNYFSENNDYMISRLEKIQEDRGSNRLDIYDQTVSNISEFGLFEWIAGRGHNMVRTDNVNSSVNGSAHNDFLEVLYDYGLIGFFMYIYLHFILINRIIFLNKTKSPYYYSYLVSYIIFFIMSMVSHLILYPSYFTFLTAFWGSLEALIYWQRKNYILQS